MSLGRIYGTYNHINMIRGFKSIESLGWDECQRLLQTEKDTELRAEIEQRLDELAKDAKKKDDACYNACKTISDYDGYLKRFPNGSHRNAAKNLISQLAAKQEEEVFKHCSTIEQYEQYLSTYRDGRFRLQASLAIDDLFFFENSGSKSKCERYLAKYPDGRHATEAQSIINKIKRNRIIWLVIIAIIATIFILSYHPAGPVSFGSVISPTKSPISLSASFQKNRLLSFPTLSVSLSSDSQTRVSFPKEGGMQEVTFSSRANSENIEVISNDSWISASKTSIGKIKITAQKNEGAKRTGTITIRAWTTLMGVRTSSSDGTIYVEQDAGHASFLSISPSEVTFPHSGGSKTLTVNTDGFWEISTSTAWWGHLSRSGNTITLRVDSNPELERSDYFELKSGEKTTRVNVTQLTNPSFRGASISEVRVTTGNTIDGEDGISVHVSFNTYNMKDKSGSVTCYFYDSSGNALVDKNERYCTTNGKVCSSESINPKYDNSRFGDFVVSIPGRELHLDGSATREIKVNVIIWDKSGATAHELTRKDGTSFTYTPKATFLSPSQEGISVPYTGGTRTISVTTDGPWDFGVRTDSWIELSRSGNTITLNIKKNNSSDSRDDYFTIKSGSLEKRISIYQSGDNTPSAVVNRVWINHNVTRTGYNIVYNPYFGPQQVPYTYYVMQIHVNFDVKNMKGKTVRVCAFFYDEDGDKMRTSNNQYMTPDGQVTVQNTGNATYESSNWSDYILEIPNSILTKGDNKFQIQIQDSNGNALCNSEYQYFKY